MPRPAPVLAAAALLALAGLSAVAQHAQHSGHGAAADPATAAYMAAAQEMHHAMDIAYVGDPDIDFARGMIPHHEGAVAMARIVLEHGQDPEIRELAQTIIATQEEEIAVLRDWLARHGGP